MINLPQGKPTWRRRPARHLAKRPRRAPVLFALGRREFRAFIELFALLGFAIAQPLYDIFGRAPDQFIFRGALTSDIYAFAAVILLGPALALYAAEVVVGTVAGFVWANARRWIHVSFVSVLVAVFAIGAIRSLFTGPLLVGAGLLLGCFAGLVYMRTRAARLWLGFAAFAPPVFCAIFLLSSQTATLLSDPAAAGDIQIRKKAPVVMIVFDELPLNSLMDRDGTIDAALFPNFAALAKTSHWFRNTTTVSNFTLNAVPALVTGQLPKNNTAPTASSHPNNLFTLVGASMGLSVTESVTRLCPSSLCASAVPRDGGLGGLLRDARHILRTRVSPNETTDDPVAGLVERAAPTNEDDQATVGTVGTAASASFDRAREFLDGIADDSNTVHFLHILLPHVPFRYLPDGGKYAGPDPDLGRDGDTWEDQPWLVDLGRQRHLLQLAYADALLGQTIAKMKTVGAYDSAALVVVADHGISFQPGQGIRGLDVDKPINDSVAADIMWVPFFAKAPGQTSGEVSDNNVLTIDVLPTIADMLDVDLPWKIDGRSALGPARASNTKAMFQADRSATEFLAGKAYKIDNETGWRLMRSRAVDTFLPKGAKQRLWSVGPNPELTGTLVTEARAGTLVKVGATFDPASNASNVQTSSGQFPALVRATLSGVRQGQALAVAVNGTIQATAPAYLQDGAVRVAAIVADTSFVAGNNTIAVYRITS